MQASHDMLNIMGMADAIRTRGAPKAHPNPDCPRALAGGPFFVFAALIVPAEQPEETMCEH